MLVLLVGRPGPVVFLSAVRLVVVRYVIGCSDIWYRLGCGWLLWYVILGVLGG